LPGNESHNKNLPSRGKIDEISVYTMLLPIQDTL